MLEHQGERTNADVFNIVTQQARIGVRNNQADNQDREHIEQQDSPEHLTYRAWNVFRRIFGLACSNTGVAIARALINKPKILLADEPTGNLDNNNAWEIMKLMEEINNNGTTVVVVTHNREIVKAMNKRVITMQKGVIVDDSDTASSIVTGDNAISRSLTERDVLKREGDYDYED